MYKDTVGILTVGIGHNLVADPALDILHRVLKLGDIITAQEVHLLFERDVGRCVDSLRCYPFWSKLNDARKYALIDMRFNLRVSRFYKIRAV